MNIKLTAILATLSLSVCFGSATQAADWPQRSIRLIVPGSPGGAADIPARLFAEKLGEKLGQSVVVENKPGAGGIIGLRALASAKPDGYTLTLTPAATIAVVPWLQEDPSQHPAKQLTPIGLFAYTPLAIAVKSDSRFKTLDELLSASRQDSEPLVIANPGVNTLAHLSSQLVNTRSGANLLPVSFSGFSGGMQAIHNGDATAIIDGISPILAQAQSGAFKILAIASDKPLPGLEAYPLLNQAVPNTVSTGWFGLFGPENLPASISEKLSETLEQIRQDAALTQKLQTMGIYASDKDTPASFATYVQQQSTLWGDLIKEGEAKGNAAKR